jgi:hypothetical protein
MAGKYKDKHGKSRISWEEGTSAGDVVDGVAGALGAVSQISSNLKAANTMDARGDTLGQKDIAGNTIAAAGAGAKLGSMFGPLGGAIGGAAGALFGAGASLFADTPSAQEQAFKEGSFQVGKNVGTVLPEGAFAQQPRVAKDGMDVKGTNKPIEVERGELVLRAKGKAFYIDASFDSINRKSHTDKNEKGETGEKYNATTGDIIFPKEQTATVKRHLKNRNFRAIESMRLALPSDEGQTKFAKGVSVLKDMLREDPEAGSPVTYYKTKKKFSKRKKTEEIIYHRTANDSTKYGVVDTLGPTIDKEKKHANVYIDKKGNITWVNDPDSVAYHDKGNNERSFGIEIGGNMVDGKYEALTPEQTAALEKVTNFAFKKYGLNETNLKSHSESDGGKGARFNEGNDAVTAMQSLYKENPFTDDSEVAQFDGASVKYAAQKGLTGQVGTGKSITVKASELNIGSTPKEEKAVIANNDEFKVDSYKSYSEKEVLNGEEPESEEWYEQNVAAKADEKRKGYSTLASYSGRQKYKDLGIKRKGYDFVPDVDPINPKNKLRGFNDVRDTIVENWKSENPGKELPSSWGDFADKDYDKAKANQQFSGNWTDDLATGVVNAIIKPFYQSTKEARNDDFHDIEDEKLRNDIIKAYDYVSTTEDNGTLVGRVFDRGLQRFDNSISDVLDGFTYQGIKRAASLFPGAGILTTKKIGKDYYNDPGNNVGTSIYNLIASGTLEEQEKIIKGAIEKHNLGPQAQEYLYELWSNPEIFKNQSMEAAEDLNVVLAVAELPRLLYSAGTWIAKGGVPKAITKSKVYIDAVKAGKIYKNGKVTAAGLKYLRSSKAYKRQMRAAELAPKGSTPVKSFRKSLDNLFKNADGTTGDAALNDELAKLTDGITADSNLFQDASAGFKDSFNFFKNSWGVIKKLPDNITKNMSGLGFKEANVARKKLEDLTGMTAKELKAQGPEGLKALLDKKTVAAFDEIKNAQKSYDDAWKAHTKLKKTFTTQKAKLDKLPEGSDELKAATKELQDISEQMEPSVKYLKELQAQKNLRWDRIGKIEDFVASDNVNWKNAVKGEEATAKHLETLEIIDEELMSLAREQKHWTKVGDEATTNYKTAYGKVQKTLDQTFKTADAKNAKNAAAKKGAAENLNLVNAKRRAVSASELAEEAPELMKAINKHEDVLKLFNSTGRFTAEVYNALRKQGPVGPEVEEEANMFLPDDRKEAKGVVIPEINPDKEESSDPDEVIINNNKKEEEKKEEEENDDKSRPVLDAVNEGLSTLGSYAGAAYNIARGLEASEKANRNYVNPALEKYEDNSQAQRNVIDDAFGAAMGNSRNLSGGLASNFRSNIEKSWADKVGRTSQVNAQEAQNAIGVAGRNVQRVNQAGQYNASVDNKADQMDMQSRAATKGFLGQGLADIANIGQMRTKDKNQQILDEKLREEYGIFGNRKTKT